MSDHKEESRNTKGKKSVSIPEGVIAQVEKIGDELGMKFSPVAVHLMLLGIQSLHRSQPGCEQ